MPSKFIIPTFSGDILQMIMDRQIQAIETFLKQKSDDPMLFNPRVCIFWDDYNGKGIKFNEKLDDYYYTGRFVFFFRMSELAELVKSRTP